MALGAKSPPTRKRRTNRFVILSSRAGVFLLSVLCIVDVIYLFVLELYERTNKPTTEQIQTQEHCPQRHKKAHTSNNELIRIKLIISVTTTSSSIHCNDSPNLFDSLGDIAHWKNQVNPDPTRMQTKCVYFCRVSVQKHLVSVDAELTTPTQS